MTETRVFRGPDGIELTGDRRPGDGPAILLLHAGVADRRAWADVADDLAGTGADVVTYDRRGFGDTPAAGTPDHLADLAAVVEQSTSSPAFLVGNSQGGRLALDLALTRPELVAGLLLIAPAVSGARDPGDDELDPDTLRLDGLIEAADAAGDLGEVNRLEAHLWLDGPASEEGRVDGPSRELALAMNAVALAAEWPEGAASPDELDTWDRLGEIAAPTTVVWGELDLPFFVDQCKALAELLPDVRAVVEIPAAAHLPGLEDPGRVAALVREAVAA